MQSEWPIYTKDLSKWTPAEQTASIRVSCKTVGGFTLDKVVEYDQETWYHINDHKGICRHIGRFWEAKAFLCGAMTQKIYGQGGCMS